MSNYIINDELFLTWFAGFVAGEGCFKMAQRQGQYHWRTDLVIALRDDDLDILLEIQERLGIGTISHSLHSGGERKTAARWEAGGLSNSYKLVTILDTHPLRARKQKDYLVWREAVLENQKPPAQRDLAKMKFLADKLRLVRTYEPPEEIDFESSAIQLTFSEENENKEGDNG